MRAWGGRAAQRMVTLCLELYGTRCHLCGHDGADSADHLVPRVQAPERTFDITNLRPAHHRPCPTCRIRCNGARGVRALAPTRPAVTDGSAFID